MSRLYDGVLFDRDLKAVFLHVDWPFRNLLHLPLHNQITLRIQLMSSLIVPVHLGRWCVVEGVDEAVCHCYSIYKLELQGEKKHRLTDSKSILNYFIHILRITPTPKVFASGN